jgi:hypothetical protein
MNATKPKKEVKFPAKTIPMARLEKWKTAMREAQDMEKQIQEAQLKLVGLRAVAEARGKDLAEDFGIGPKDQINLETGEITKG